MDLLIFDYYPTYHQKHHNTFEYFYHLNLFPMKYSFAGRGIF